MRKLLLFLLMSAMSVSASMAQAVGPRTAARNNKTVPMPIQMHRASATKQVKEVKTQIMPDFPLVTNQEKIVSSISHGDNKIQIVQNADGTFSKRFVQNSVDQKPNSRSTALANQSAASDTFFESFEDWGESKKWLPKDWSRNNQTTIETWYTCHKVLYTPTDGKYAAWVDWGIDLDDDFNYIYTDPRDEMIISSAFTPRANDYLIFDALYSTYFMFFDMITEDFDFDNPSVNYQVLASTDNGVTWDVIWEASKVKDYSNFKLENLRWYTHNVSLSAYIGKSIKIAFRYADRNGGDDAGLDNIAVRELTPKALYMRPQGYLYGGLLQNWGYYDFDLMLGHAYDKAVWRNLSTEAETYSWMFDNPDGSNTTVTRTEENPDVTYPYIPGIWFAIPTLTATLGKTSSTYQWGSSANRFLQTGGSLDTGGKTYLGAGNYNLAYDLYTYSNGPGSYMFGTNNVIKAVANAFEKPGHKYILEGVWAALSVFSFNTPAEFKMTIYRVVNGRISDDDIIATSTCTEADVKKIAATAYTMPFTKFTMIDPETGLEIENDDVEIEDAVLIAIEGFNNVPGTEICFLAQEFSVDYTGVNNAFIFTKDGRLGSYAYYGYTSLVFNLELTYSFLLPDSNLFIAPNEGGSKSFNVTSYYSPDGWWMEEALPEWLSDDYTFNSNTWEIIYTLKAKPLPPGVDYREAVVKIITYGADMSITVRQGKGAGLYPITVATNQVVNKGDNFELIYTSDYSAVSVYNIAGQKLADYTLPDAGSFTVPSGNYHKGIYLFSFTGAKGASTVKVVK